MTEFRVGQRVRCVVPDGAAWGFAIGCVLGTHSDGMVKVSTPVDPHGVWFDPPELTPIPEPGIPAHLVRTGTDPASRHWPVWRAQP